MMFSREYSCRSQPCTAGLFTLIVIPNGSVHPCFQLTKEDISMGNILDDFFPQQSVQIRIEDHPA
jgi:radical SAM protein with 4Fe4S-binding SPASM domain